jgi:hypothetical protein
MRMPFFYRNAKWLRHPVVAEFTWLRYLQGWAFSAKVDRVPSDQVALFSLSSLETLQLSLSAASFESIRDLLEFVRDFTPRSTACTSKGGLTDLMARGPALQSQLGLQAAQMARQSATEPKGNLPIDRNEGFNLFEVVNRTGLGMACYVGGDKSGRSSSHMQMASTNASKPLLFRPGVEFVHLPDFGRKVGCHLSRCTGLIHNWQCCFAAQFRDSNNHWFVRNEY